MPTDYYALLGVSAGATDDQIKKAYRKLARELHPDANPGDKESEERFKEVTLAYETLRDPERRHRYDMFGPDGAKAGAGGEPFAGFAAGLGDLFEVFLGGARTGGRGGAGGRAGPLRGPDIEVSLEIDFEEAVFGAEKKVTLRAPFACDACGARGSRGGATPRTCPTCAGTGQVRQVRQSILGQMVTAGPCPACRGMGEEVVDPCPECRGEGRRPQDRTYTVAVPAGVDGGLTLRFGGWGASGPRAGPPGDLFVHLAVRPHSRFQRHGFDLRCELAIAMTQAALGAHLSVETLDGAEDLVIPPGTQSGRTFSLRGRGVHRRDGRGRGDLFVQIRVEVPTGLTKAQQAALRQLADERAEPVAPPDTGFLSRIRSAFT